MIMKNLKSILPDVIAVVFFAVLSYLYFFPADSEGRILAQHDSIAGIGAGQEAKEYQEKTGNVTRWTNALFGGMPTYQMAPSYNSTDTLKTAENIYHLYLPSYVYLVFIMLLGFYILLRAFNFKVWMSALGAVIWAFSSYFFILIAAGHIWKFVTLAYIPPTIAGMVLAYKGKYLKGGLLTAFFVALQIRSNHVQMSYYFLFVMLFMAIAYAVDAYRKKEMLRFYKATATLVLAALVGVCINLSNLYHTYEYSKETMRGKSELVKKNENQANQTNSGLERDYITQWSYGIGETWSLLVPNVKGGASVPLSQNDVAMKKADMNFVTVYNQLGQYWGDQPGTSGPVYVGAFVLFLFILGIFIVKGPMKYALVAATLLSIVLSWGKNFMGFTDFFLDYIPMYDKFRAVSSILVIAEFTIPLLAVMALKEIVDNPKVLVANKAGSIVSVVLTAGMALIFYLAPTFFFPNYIPASEMSALQGGIPGEYLGQIVNNLKEMRMAIFTADAARSFIIILIGLGFLLAYYYKRLQANVFVICITVLCLVDMWQVNKRYLNDEMFVDQDQREVSFQKTETDKVILQDKTLDYRVLNMASNTFNENNTSYWHKSVGGYHAAKLRRYQEVIDEHIFPEMQTIFKEVSESGGDMVKVDGSKFPVINMLNTRWLIFPLKDNSTFPLRNPYAYGNAWFVKQLKYVGNANAEIDALNKVNLRDVAVVDSKFKSELGEASAVQGDSLNTVTLKSYEPNALKYEVNSAKGGLVVFSEIYYPGWQSFIDGKEVPHGRADYILRAMKVPAGKHVVEFTFNPQSIKVTEAIAYSAVALLVIVFLVSCGYSIGKNLKKKS